MSFCPIYYADIATAASSCAACGAHLTAAEHLRETDDSTTDGPLPPLDKAA
jgi:hypothetical protein